MFTDKEKQTIIYLVADKIDICERHIRKFNKDAKKYAERRNWIPGEELGSDDSNYAKEIRRQISLEQKKIDDYNTIIEKVRKLG